MLRIFLHLVLAATFCAQISGNHNRTLNDPSPPGECRPNNILTNKTGVIYTKMYSTEPHDQRSFTCRWTIKGSKGKVIRLTFQNIFLEARMCNFDFLDVYDGETTSSELKRICDKKASTPDIYSSNGQSITLIFKGRRSHNGPGFMISYVSRHAKKPHKINITTSGYRLSCSALGTPPPHLTLHGFGQTANGVSLATLTMHITKLKRGGHEVKCSAYNSLGSYHITKIFNIQENMTFHLTAGSGKISMPKNEDALLSLGAKSKTWIITAMPNHIVKINIGEINIPSDDCQHNSLTFYDGSSLHSSRIKRLCKNTMNFYKNLTIKSTGHFMTINFKTSDVVGSMFSFELNYTSEISKNRMTTPVSASSSTSSSKKRITTTISASSSTSTSTNRITTISSTSSPSPDTETMSTPSSVSTPTSTSMPTSTSTSELSHTSSPKTKNKFTTTSSFLHLGSSSTSSNPSFTSSSDIPSSSTSDSTTGKPLPTSNPVVNESKTTLQIRKSSPKKSKTPVIGIVFSCFVLVVVVIGAAAMLVCRRSTIDRFTALRLSIFGSRAAPSAPDTTPLTMDEFL